MENCKPGATAIANDGEYLVRTFCETHNPGGMDTRKTADVNVSEGDVEKFLDEGYFGVLVGQVQSDLFDAVLDSLIRVGSESAAAFKARI
jgi:hypothetical protein